MKDYSLKIMPSLSLLKPIWKDLLLIETPLKLNSKLKLLNVPMLLLPLTNVYNLLEDL